MLAACGGASTAPAVIANSAPPVDPYCPVTTLVGPWTHEMFGGCPTPPFDDVGVHVCSGACPRPCAYESHHGRDMAIDAYDAYWTIAFDAQGRFASEGVEETTHTSYTCSYDAYGRPSACQYFTNAMSAMRDATGRVVRIVDRDKPITITWDGQGT